MTRKVSSPVWEGAVRNVPLGYARAAYFIRPVRRSGKSPKYCSIVVWQVLIGSSVVIQLLSVHHEIVVTTSVVRAKQRPKPVL